MGEIYFKDNEEFSNFIREFKPNEIWFDIFSKDEPYILANYTEDMLIGCYNHQTLLGAKLNELDWLFEEGMYCKKIN
jgi:hypothetical protein